MLISAFVGQNCLHGHVVYNHYEFYRVIWHTYKPHKPFFERRDRECKYMYQDLPVCLKASFYIFSSYVCNFESLIKALEIFHISTATQPHLNQNL